MSLMRRIRGGWGLGLRQGDVLVWLGTLVILGQLFVLFFGDARDLDPRRWAFGSDVVATAPATSAAPTAPPRAQAAAPARPAAAPAPRPAVQPTPAPAAQPAPRPPAQAAARPSTLTAVAPSAAAPPRASAPTRAQASPAPARPAACSVERVAGAYRSQFGAIACEARGGELRCCYGGTANCDRQLHLRLASDARSVTGLWIYQSGERGSAAFPLKEDCSLDSGRWGWGPTPDQPWQVSGRS